MPEHGKVDERKPPAALSLSLESSPQQRSQLERLALCKFLGVADELAAAVGVGEQVLGGHGVLVVLLPLAVVSKQLHGLAVGYAGQNRRLAGCSLYSLPTAVTKVGGVIESPVACVD